MTGSRASAPGVRRQWKRNPVFTLPIRKSKVSKVLRGVCSCPERGASKGGRNVTQPSAGEDVAVSPLLLVDPEGRAAGKFERLRGQRPLGRGTASRFG
jgi:hypothetical protein